MAEKKYYWLKMTDQFFEDKAIKKLRKIAGGDTYTIIYLKMLLTAIKQGNKMYFEGIEDDFMEELALELDEDTDNVKVTVSYLKSKGLIEVLGADEILLTQCAEMVGSETDAARRKRLQRDRERNRAIGTDPVPALEEKPEVVVEEKPAKKKAENTIQLFHRLVEDYNISEPVREKMEVWFRYKMERKESYKEQGMKSLLKKTENNEESYGANEICREFPYVVAGTKPDRTYDARLTALQLQASSEGKGVEFPYPISGTKPDRSFLAEIEPGALNVQVDSTNAEVLYRACGSKRKL